MVMLTAGHQRAMHNSLPYHSAFTIVSHQALILLVTLSPQPFHRMHDRKQLVARQVHQFSADCNELESKQDAEIDIDIESGEG